MSIRAERIAGWLAVGYLMVAIYTFGYAASHYRPGSYEGRADAAAAGVFGGAMWPLYWSWWAQS